MVKVVKSAEEWRSLLSAESYDVVRCGGTERAFSGEYYGHEESGNYCCVCCGEVLFTSDSKFDSGTGWPSFTSVASGSNIEEREDRSLWCRRVEVLCGSCDAHLGHVFEDGPAPTGLRYCINSVALSFEKS